MTQCPCGGDAKPTATEHPWRLCDACGRAIRRSEWHPLFDLPPPDAGEYEAMLPLVVKARQKKEWTFAHESAIIDAIRNGRL